MHAVKMQVSKNDFSRMWATVLWQVLFYTYSIFICTFFSCFLCVPFFHISTSHCCPSSLPSFSQLLPWSCAPPALRSLAEALSREGVVCFWKDTPEEGRPRNLKGIVCMWTHFCHSFAL